MLCYFVGLPQTLWESFMGFWASTNSAKERCASCMLRAWRKRCKGTTKGDREDGHSQKKSWIASGKTYKKIMEHQWKSLCLMGKIGKINYKFPCSIAMLVSERVLVREAIMCLGHIPSCKHTKSIQKNYGKSPSFIGKSRNDSWVMCQ